MILSRFMTEKTKIMKQFGGGWLFTVVRHECLVMGMANLKRQIWGVYGYTGEFRVSLDRGIKIGRRSNR